MTLLMVAILSIPYDFIDKPGRGLIMAGRELEEVQVCFSPEHPILWKAAYDHARYQAKHQMQGHQNWTTRWRALRKRLPGYRITEICAESWYWETHDSYISIGKSMFESWKTSSGHWDVATKKHDIYGASMAMGKNGIWYACIIVGDRQ